MVNYYAEFKPEAIARYISSPAAPKLYGESVLTQLSYGVLIVTNVYNIPTNDYIGRFHGFHIHDKPSCELGDPDEAFSKSGGHYNPKHAPHPFHAGDLPPLLTTKEGYAYQAVVTDRFRLEDIIGLPFIIHNKPDDFVTQPSGNAGTRLACGIIESL